MNVSKITTVQVLLTDRCWMDDEPFDLPPLPLLANLEVFIDLPAMCVSRDVDFEDYGARAALSNDILDSVLYKRSSSLSLSDVVETPLSLKSFGVRGLDLRNPSRSLIALLCSDGLNHLNFNGCYQAIAPLQLAMSNHSATMGSLRSLVMTSPNKRSMRLDVDAINNALDKMSGLRTVCINGVNSSPVTDSVDSDRYISIDALKKHQSTLEYLYIDIADKATKKAIHVPGNFIPGLSTFHRLEQLAFVPWRLLPERYARNLVSIHIYSKEEQSAAKLTRKRRTP